VPKTVSGSRDQRVFVDDAADLIAALYAERVEMDDPFGHP
jgi:hypothetical protein